MKLTAGANADVVNRREMEITSKLPPVDASATSTLVSDDSVIGRPPTGSLTDAIMVTELRRDIADLRAEAESASRHAEMQAKRLQAREAEIARLSGLVESGQDMERFNLESINQTNQRIIETLNDQVDFLNEELAEKDAQLAERDDAKAKLERTMHQLQVVQVWDSACSDLVAMPNQPGRVLLMSGVSGKV